MTEYIIPFARWGFNSGRNLVRQVGTSMIEEPIGKDRSTLVLPPSMQQDRIDWLLLLSALSLLGIGLLMVLSSTSFAAQTAQGNPYGRFFAQGVRGLIGVALMIVAIRLDYRRLSSS